VIRGAALVCGVSLLLACASEPPAPTSPLRGEAARAAETGSRRFAGRHYQAAAGSFARAAELYGVLDDPVAEATALRNQGEALRRAGELADAAARFERALALDRRGDRPTAQARDLTGLARCHAGLGEMERAIQEAERALSLAGGAELLRPSLEIDLATYLLARKDAADRERVIALLRSGAAGVDPRTRATAHLHLGRAYRRFGSPALAEETLEQALDAFRALDHPEGLARTHEELGFLFRSLGDTEGARGHLEQARRGYDFLGDEAARARVDGQLGEGRD
jgi:tetratricopeptide (TPR) repeat protein